MAEYFCKIELKGTPDADAYTKLNAGMRTAGFFTEMRNTESEIYALPKGMYFVNADLPLENVNQVAINIARNVQPEVSVLTIVSQTYSGMLDKVS